MLVKVASGALFGLEVLPVTVEVDVSTRGFPSFDIVGLPSKSVAESKHRIKTALLNSDIEFPKHRITVNLAPADIPKEGCYYDLPIALGIMACVNKITISSKVFVVGEVSLDGSVRRVKGGLLFAGYAKEAAIGELFLPVGTYIESTKGTILREITNLKSLLGHITGEKELGAAVITNELPAIDTANYADFSEIIDQDSAKRGLEIAAAGGHNIMLHGPPGVGKTMLAKSFVGILPPLSFSERLEVARVLSVADPSLDCTTIARPFRSPHHTISHTGLIGGGTLPQPGEITKAHRGVLFLDEFPEFSRYSIESLREPIENGIVRIARSRGVAVFPCKFLLITAMNPCPCGYYNHPKVTCSCTPGEIRRYLKKISGPIMDRIDMSVRMWPVSVEKVELTSHTSLSESSKDIAKRVASAKSAQRTRYKDLPVSTNSELGTDLVKEYCNLTLGADRLLRAAVEKMNLSMRGLFSTLKVALTIADLDGSTKIDQKYLSEALCFKAQTF